LATKGHQNLGIKHSSAIRVISKDSDELKEMMQPLNEASKSMPLEMNTNETKIMSAITIKRDYCKRKLIHLPW